MCEFLAADLRGPYTVIDLNDEGLPWTQRLAEQDHSLANDESALIIQAELLFEQYKDHQCQRPNIRGHKCLGKTVIRSLSPEKKRGTVERIFIGCELHQGREKDHTLIPIKTAVDFPTLLRTFGRTRVKVHSDILDAIGFCWDEVESGNLKSLTNI